MDLAFAAVMAVATWFVVTRFVMPHLLVFGRRKLSAMILVGSVLVWIAEASVVSVTNGAFQPWRGSVLGMRPTTGCPCSERRRRSIAVRK